MPQPPQVVAAPDDLIAMFETAQADIEQQLAAIQEGRRAARLRELQRTVNRVLGELEQQTHAWLTGVFPTVYEAGATGAAETLGEVFVWTQPHLAAVQALAETSWDDLLGATRFVRRDVKAWIRSEARQQATLSLIEGRTARQAGRALADAAGGDLGVFTVTYRNGAHVRLADYSDMALRTTTANAFAEGTINQSRDLGVQVMECSDGADCGMQGHDDAEKPNGNLYPIDVAATNALSHPRCRRSWIPRVDVPAADISTATSLRSEAQRADQAASEQLATSTRTQRQPRTPRTPRSASRTAA